jgi:hypothetical protein
MSTPAITRTPPITTAAVAAALVNDTMADVAEVGALLAGFDVVGCAPQGGRNRGQGGSAQCHAFMKRLPPGWLGHVYACGPTVTRPTVSVGVASITAPTRAASSSSSRRCRAVSSRSGSTAMASLRPERR